MSLKGLHERLVVDLGATPPIAAPGASTAPRGTSALKASAKADLAKNPPSSPTDAHTTVASKVPPPPPAAPSRTPPDAMAGAGGPASVLLGIAALYPLVAGTLTAVTLLSNWSPPLWVLRWFVPVPLLSLGKYTGGLGAALVAVLALVTFVTGIAANRAARPWAIATGGTALGLVTAAVFAIGARGFWDEVPTLLGFQPYGSLSGIFPASVAFILVAITLAVGGFLAVAAAPAAAAGLSTAGGTASTTTATMGLGPCLAVFVGCTVLVAACGFAASHNRLGDANEVSFAYSPSYPSSPSSGTSSGSNSSSSSSSSSSGRSSSQSTTTTLPSRLSPYSTYVSCGSLGSTFAPTEYYESTRTRVTACRNSSGTVGINYSQSGGSSGSYTGSVVGDQYQAKVGANTLVVDGSAIRFFDSTGEVVTLEAVTRTSAPSVTSFEDVMRRLASLMDTSSHGRRMIKDLANGLSNGCTVSIDQARADIKSVNANRTEMSAAAASLAAQAGSTQAPVGLFAEAMQHSLDADLALERWINGRWASTGGCAGSVLKKGDVNFDAFDAASQQATASKQALVARFNPLAAPLGLKSDWKYEDV